ncbi:MAG: ABC-ATPase domain-containing protein [Proteobacteria bacterium]|nr:ABC-ATPase domain-containing protein [Pseudomonadota bacterium]
MRTEEDLRAFLQRIDGRGYPAYKDLSRQRFAFDGFELCIDHVQGDPFAAPSRVRVILPMDVADFDLDDVGPDARRVALADLLCRRFGAVASETAQRRGSGKSGAIEIARCGQEVLERTAVILDEGRVEARFTVGLPAQGRRVRGRAAAALLCDDIPRIVDAALLRDAWEEVTIRRHLDAVEDARALRAQLADAGLVAFVADGAILPRRSGIDDRPMADGAIPFRSPDSLATRFELPYAGQVRGMGVPRGVTLIVGGGYHGKSTLLQAVERGVYDHVAGDGRELVVADAAAVKVRAEDGRAVAGVDISPFINGLPGGMDTSTFSTPDASGSTSQAASIVEAIEAGASALLLDEDTSATNFLIRDRRMQELVHKGAEPITPLVDKVRQLHRDHGLSALLVMGGSGDYFDVADTVIGMEAFVPWDATARARAIATEHRTDRVAEGGETFGELRRRRPRADSLNPRRGKRDVNLRSRGTRSIEFGRDEIDLSAVEQLVDGGQTRAIAETLEFARSTLLDGARDVAAVLDAVDAAIAARGLDAVQSRPAGDLARFRRFELAAALNRLRSLRID